MSTTIRDIAARALILAAVILGAGCAAEPPADPAAVLAAAFDLPVDRTTVVASGGPSSDAWLCFTCEERVQLVDGEAFTPVDPQPAHAFFAAALPADPIASDSAEAYVCLEHEASAAGYRWLLFEIGSGRYYYRSWHKG